MVCPRCGAPSTPGRKFCGQCGAELAAACAGCGARGEPGDRFCGQCGRALPAADPTPPRVYTPKHLADRILTSRSALEGERKQVTVLFCDIVDSTRLAERLDPETMHEVMDRALRLMAEAVHRYEGTVNQFLGDGLMALFGAPVALEDHALRAVEAALAMQETLGGLSAELAPERGVQIRLRFGLNTGLVVVGKIGDDLRMDYTAVGETTNLAARLQAGAEPGTIVVSEATHRLVAGYVRSDALGPVSLKGFAAPVLAYRVTGRRRRTRLEVSAERGVSALVGRERELGVLRERFERARQGRGQIVGIAGEPGVGKSRLLYEFRRSLEGERLTFLAGHCAAYGQATPYLPLMEILRSNFQVDEGDNALQVEEKLRRGVRDLAASLEAVVPFLREVLLARPDESLKSLDARVRRQRVFEAIRALTAAGSERAPLVLAVEDLHWIDQTSEECIGFLVESLAGLRVLLVTTHRPGYTVRWADKAAYTQLALDVLTRDEAAAVIRGLLQAERLPDGLVDRVHAKAEGNPLFVEEITRALVERGALVRQAGDVHWAREAAVEFPETAQDIIRARIDRLEEPVKRTAQVAAVIGREFGERVLAQIVDTAAALQGALETLKHAELVQEKRFFPELEYMFRHAIIQDVAYQSILIRRRRDLHAAIGRAIEVLYADRLADHYEVLAHHFAEGEVPDKAAEYLVKAGDKASALYAPREALAFYERALPLLPASAIDMRVHVLHRLGWLHFYCTVDFDRCRQYYEEALPLCERLGDRTRLITLHIDLVGLYASTAWDGAREDEALPHAEALAALIESDPDTVQKGLVYQRIAHLYLHRSQPATALTWTRRAVDLFARLSMPIGTALGTALAFTGRVDEGLAYSEGNWPTVLAAANPMVFAIFGHELMLVLALLRDPGAVQEWGERLVPEALKANSPVLEMVVRRPLVLAYTLGGDIDRAVAMIATIQAIEQTTLGGCPWQDTAAVGFHLLRRGRVDEARDHLERILPVWETRRQIAAISGCSLALASCHLELGDHAGAERHALRSLDICRDGGNVLFELWVLPVLIEVYLATGRRQAAADGVARGFALLTPDQNWRGLSAPMHLARATVAAAEGRWAEAEHDFEAAVALNRRYTMPFDEAKSLAAWGAMHLGRGQGAERERARGCLGPALALFERVDAAREVAKVRAALDRLA